jgi:hypothetical protein
VDRTQQLSEIVGAKFRDGREVFCGLVTKTSQAYFAPRTATGIA